MLKISRGESLDRYYLLKFLGYGIFLHKIHHSDPPNLYHNHPWDGVSIIFGSYIEHRIGKYWPFKTKSVRYGINWITGTHHRVEIGEQPVWTLFIHWPRCRRWTIVDNEFKVVAVEPWRGDVGHKDYAAAAMT